jgi:RNA polymerase sigma factor (sigma-70 family)
MAMGDVIVRDAGGRTEIEVEVEPTAVVTPVTFTELYTSQFQPLVRTATLLTGRVDTARDVVQDAFVRLHVKWPTVRDPLAYVRRSVVNGCRSHHRWERRRRGPRSTEEPSVELDVDHTVAALAGLSHVQRAVIVLKFYEGRTEQEIAEVLGCRPGSVGPTVQRALAKLREALT